MVLEMTEASAQWTLGVLIGLPIWGLIALAVLIAGAVLAWFAFSDDEPGIGAAFVGGTVLALAVIAGLMTFAYWPLHSEYHQYRPVTGTVQSVANRLVSAGDKGGSNQKFVVTLADHPGTPYGVTDTRAALLKPGDTVHLRCIRVYEYGSNNAGFDCKWGQ